MVTSTSSNPEIPFLRSVFPEGIEEDLRAVLRSGYVGAGDLVIAFERGLAAYLGAPSIAVTSSCTAALTLSYICAGIHEGTVVLSTPMTCAATNIPLLQLRARISWLDVDPLSGNVTAESVVQGLDQEPDAGAVVIMDWGGTPCDYTAIAEACHRRNVPVILDAAQSFGSNHGGKLYSEDVDYVCYSFGPTKLFTSVEGGGCGTGRAVGEAASQRLRDLRWYGIRRETRDQFRFWDYRVEDLGYRFVLNNVFAAIGLKMLLRIEDRLRHHRELARKYDDLLAAVPGLRICTRPGGCMPNFWLYTVLAQSRERLLTKLHSHGVHAATPHQRNDLLLGAWNGGRTSGNLAGVNDFNHQYVCLPIGPWLLTSDVENICELIKSGW